MDILESYERSIELGSTLIMLSNIWAWVALLSCLNKRRVYFVIECLLMTAFYVMAISLLLSGIMVRPWGCIGKMLFHTIINIVPMYIIIRKYTNSKKGIQQAEIIDDPYDKNESGS